MAHENTGAVPVIVGEAQALHVFEEVAAHVGLGEHAHTVAVNHDRIVERRLDNICPRHQQHDREKGLILLFGQKRVHAFP